MILLNEQTFTQSLTDIYEQNWKKKKFWTYIIYIFIPFHGIGIKVSNYYSILLELKLIDFSWICGCFPRKFALNKFVGSSVWIQDVLVWMFWSELFKLKFNHFVCELLESFWKVWTILFRLLVEPVLLFTSVLIFCLHLNMSDKEELSKLRGCNKVYRRRMESLETET